MMDIPVYYCNSFYGMLFLKVSCRDGHIVKKTKSHGPVAFCVVAGRPYRAKAVSHRAFHHVVYPFQHAPNSAKGNFKSCGTQDTFWAVQKRIGVLHRTLEFIYVPGCVAEFQEAPFRRSGLYPHKFVEKSRRLKSFHDSCESLRLFRVAVAGFVLQIYLTVDQSCFR
jgi:hypothetical protein